MAKDLAKKKLSPASETAAAKGSKSNSSRQGGKKMDKAVQATVDALIDQLLDHISVKVAAAKDGITSRTFVGIRDSSPIQMLDYVYSYMAKAAMASRLFYDEFYPTLEGIHKGWQLAETMKEDTLARAEVAEKEKKAKQREVDRKKTEAQGMAYVYSDDSEDEGEG
ncbi:uncharacterized protein LOC116143888 [Pistacia vera]|uniref:uncharacterized protein LOC116143888 n=1 Tax=Pistacia vera TaxID=55513 RepID=UPI001262F716|nr:uncharacterized protein LOC116143888 [Pistacia vera]